MRQQVMMECSVGAAPYTSVPVRSFAVYGHAQRLGYDAILHGEVRVAVAAHALIHRPGTAEVVQHNVLGVIHRYRIVLGTFSLRAFLAHAHMEETDDDVIGIFDDKRIIRQADTFSGRRLTGNSDIASRYD